MSETTPREYRTCLDCAHFDSADEYNYCEKGVNPCDPWLNSEEFRAFFHHARECEAFAGGERT